MVDLKNIRSLSDFQRNARAHVRRLKQTGKPEVLTINGQAELVVQSADAYQDLLDVLDLADSIKILRTRLKQTRRGQKGVPAEKVLSEIRARLGISKR